MECADEIVVKTLPAEHVAMMALNRPSSRNALNVELVEQLVRSLEELQQDARIRVLILTGTGDQAFCAGADLVEREGMTPEQRGEHTLAISALADAIADFPVPVIAAIRGFALAGGAELTLACDIRIAAENAIFGFPEVTIGIFPGAGGVQRLPRIIGGGLARDLLLTGRRIDAVEAHRIGLVSDVVALEDLVDSALAVAERIAGNAPLAIRALKRSLATIDTALDQESKDAFVRAQRESLDSSEDYAEGLSAFADHRIPRFKGHQV